MKNFMQKSIPLSHSFNFFLLALLLFSSTFAYAQRGRSANRNQCTHKGKVVLHDYRYGGIANAKVIYTSINGRITKSTQTQADGSYQITLPQGDYNVTAKHSFYYTPDRYGFPACMNKGENGYIVMEAQPKQGTCEHRGRVVLHDYNTGGIPNATVFYKTPDGNIKLKTVTSSEGHYAIYLPKRTFLVTAKHPQYHTPDKYKFDITCADGEGGYIVMEPNPVEGLFVPQNPNINLSDIRIAEPEYPQFGNNIEVIEKTPLEEDCISFEPHNLRVEEEGNRYFLLDEGMSLIAFDNHEEAEMSKEVMLRYHLNQQCYIGRPNPSFKYFLTDGQAPSGDMGNEDCLDFNLNNIAVAQIQGRWKIVDGNNWLFDFEGNEQEARQTFAVIKKYGFTKTCYVGRPNPAMQYLRR